MSERLLAERSGGRPLTVKGSSTLKWIEISLSPRPLRHTFSLTHPESPRSVGEEGQNLRRPPRHPPQTSSSSPETSLGKKEGAEGGRSCLFRLKPEGGRRRVVGAPRRRGSPPPPFRPLPTSVGRRGRVGRPSPEPPLFELFTRPLTSAANPRVPHPCARGKRSAPTVHPSLTVARGALQVRPRRPLWAREVVLAEPLVWSFPPGAS